MPPAAVGKRTSNRMWSRGVRELVSPPGRLGNTPTPIRRPGNVCPQMRCARVPPARHWHGCRRNVSCCRQWRGTHRSAVSSGLRSVQQLRSSTLRVGAACRAPLPGADSNRAPASDLQCTDPIGRGDRRALMQLLAMSASDAPFDSGRWARGRSADRGRYHNLRSAEVFKA